MLGSVLLLLFLRQLPNRKELAADPVWWGRLYLLSPPPQICFAFPAVQRLLPARTQAVFLRLPSTSTSSFHFLHSLPSFLPLPYSRPPSSFQPFSSLRCIASQPSTSLFFANSHNALPTVATAQAPQPTRGNNSNCARYPEIETRSSRIPLLDLGGANKAERTSYRSFSWHPPK